MPPEKTVTATSLKASKDALRAIYYVVVGLALKEALTHAFTADGKFLGWDMFKSDHLPATLLFFAYLATGLRFVHGASIHIDVLYGKRYKLILDFLGFVAQASFLYLMALTLSIPEDFEGMIIVMLAIDSAWLIALHLTNIHPLGPIGKQWLISNVVVATFMLLPLFVCRSQLAGAVFVTVVAILAAAIDYHLNREFYFPEEIT
jgi:hypothetical protein